jgi:hypothetical protein
MAIGEPLGYFGFWETVREQVPWPHSNEDALKELAAAWTTAGEAFAGFGEPAEEGLSTIWPDQAGYDYRQSINQLRTETRNTGDCMKVVGTLTDIFAYDVAYAKNQILQTIISNFGIWLSWKAIGLEQQFADKVAVALGQFLDALAAQIAARGAGRDPAEEEELPVVQPIDSPWTLSDPRHQKGADRETRVAELTGGTVVGEYGGRGLEISGPSGKSDVDVIGPNGEFIAVGGPGKAGNLEVTTDKLEETKTRLNVLMEAAAEQGVRAQAWFADATPMEVLQLAQQVLGPENVYVFDE